MQFDGTTIAPQEIRVRSTPIAKPLKRMIKVHRFPRALEHFHFYSEQDRAAKCGFTSTPASELAGDPGFEEKPRWARSLCKHQK